MEGKTTGKGKTGEPGKGAAMVEPPEDRVAEDVEKPPLDREKVAVSVAGAMVTTPIVLATGHTVTSSREGSGGVPSSLADDVLMTRYKAWVRLQNLRAHTDAVAEGLEEPPGDHSEVLGVTEVAVVTMDGLRALLRAAGLDDAIGLGLSEDTK